MHVFPLAGCVSSRAQRCEGGRTLTAEVVFVDEFDRASAADEIVVFELDGVRYEIYLSRENATKLRDAFAAWIGAARQTATRQRRHLFSTTLDSAEAAAMRRAAIRQWAWTYGHGVAVHGRIPREVLKAYEAAHARKVRHTT
ncbi:histone-like nucleoid-structuring protein Lsr2 [Mycolicibacterium holsaticum]|nr:Lsr2 family protein [Mycolicibacterium holsaticum]QZA15102.1 Lsr2 family protein [Mycolicibacterium holsaticum DSM 44478 = JCM 12374]UNC12627.1 Lsr2 family protein [Mycolicibacterium holsaticum DSM 44478 = JCM 12374]